MLTVNLAAGRTLFTNTEGSDNKILQLTKVLRLTGVLGTQKNGLDKEREATTSMILNGRQGHGMDIISSPSRGDGYPSFG